MCFSRVLFFQGYPIEAFHHDPETLAYFFDMDVRRGRPSLPQMIAEGIVLPKPCSQSAELKEKATELLAHPIVLSKEQILHIRYAIGDCIWDLKEPRSHAEAIGTGVVLYEMLANFYLQSHGHWGTSGKWLSTSITQSKP